MSMHPVKPRRTLRSVGMVALMAAGAVAVPAIDSVPIAQAVACTSYCGGGEFHAVPFAHIVDTGTGFNAPLGPKPISPGAGWFDLTVLGRGAMPPTSVAPLAEVLSIIVAGPTVSGTLAVWGAGEAESQPAVTFAANQTSATTVIVHAGVAGRIRLRMRGASTGTARIIVDQVGWYSSTGYDGSFTGGDPRGWRTIPIATPTRVLDTRNGALADTPLGPRADRAIAIRGAHGIGSTTVVVPNNGTVVGAVLSVTAWSATAATRVTVQPTSTAAMPAAGQLYSAPRQVHGNLVIAPVGADGTVHLVNYAGSTNVTVDIVGFMRTPGTETTRGGRVVPLAAPFRAFDTRQAAFGKVPLGPGQAEDWSFAAFVSSVKIGGTWVGKQVAFLGTLASTSLTRQYAATPVGTGSLTVYPSPLGRPGVTSLVTREGAATSGPVLVRYGTNQVVRVFNQAGYDHYLIDVGAVVLSD